MKAEDVRILFKLIAWLTQLPHDLELKFREDLATYERKEKPMTVESLLSPYEAGIRAEALQDSILDILQTKFGSLPDIAVQHVKALSDEALLRRATKTAVTALSIEDFLAQLS